MLGRLLAIFYGDGPGSSDWPMGDLAKVNAYGAVVSGSNGDAGSGVDLVGGGCVESVGHEDNGVGAELAGLFEELLDGVGVIAVDPEFG